jgi:hypothetical protein
LKFQTENLGLEFWTSTSPHPERSSASPYLSAGTAHSAGPTHFRGLGAPSLFFLRFFIYLGLIFFFPKTLKKQFLPERQKSQKSVLFVICGPILVAFWIHFGVLLPEKLNVKTGNRKGQENHQKSCFSEE